MSTTPHRPLDETTKTHARELRQAQTPAEARLWGRLRNSQLAGFKFRRQHPIGPYIVDFYCYANKLAVEVDGDTHVGREGYDAARTAWLESQGCRVIRFTNLEVLRNLDAVLQEIADACQAPSP